MAYNTVPIKKDSEGKPIPQYYNKIKNEYEVLEGKNGASKIILYDEDGNPIDLVELIETIIDILNQKNLPTNASTESKQEEILAKLNEGIKTNGSTMEYYGLSNETKPSTAIKGSTFFEIDTQTVYMYDGISWVVI